MYILLSLQAQQMKLEVKTSLLYLRDVSHRTPSGVLEKEIRCGQTPLFVVWVKTPVVTKA